jgi:GxxExxY protein
MNKMNKMTSLYEHAPLTEVIIGCAMKVHRRLGAGFLESVYQRALIVELARVGMKADREMRIAVYYEGVQVGDFVADLVINDVVILEIKAVRTLAPAHEVQLVNYLTATGIDVGLLLNFGAARLEYKRKARLLDPI